VRVRWLRQAARTYALTELHDLSEYNLACVIAYFTDRVGVYIKSAKQDCCLS
jgi:hypothetical protein